MRIQIGIETERYDPYNPATAPFVQGRHAKGSSGSSSTTTIDAAYNARMATIAEEQQEMADWYMDWMKGDVDSGENSYIDVENAKLDANMELIPGQTELSLAQIEAEKSLLPGQTALTQEQIAAQRELMPAQTELASDTLAAGSEKLSYQRDLMPTYFDTINKGLDVKGSMDRASADVTQAYSGSEDATRREAARMGMMPASSRTLSRLADTNLNRSRDIAFARTNARTSADTENLTNMRSAMEL